jgi:WD40 repeat protein
MADERTRFTHSIFMKALDVEAGEREAYLRSACGDDSVLLTRIKSLMGAMDKSAGFLETPALGKRHEDPSRISVRGYRVLRIVGVGGMATVYEARQEQPERTVALKVMNRALSNTSALRRFKYETEVLARLRHPGIAQIFEAGTCDDGQGNASPFFAMEYIDSARTLTEHAEDLPLRQRLAMFAEVCDAVQHGHQLGVIHRDLKPANILIDAAGRPRIIDFGIARSTNPDHAGLTARADIGQLIGTLNYMSPEQCAGKGELDARTDVYSLGVILYRLIAGRLPHNLEKANIPQAVRIITEESPARLGAITPEARGDLEAIVSKAMEKDPAYRYSSAGALGTDIRRYLRDQPIDARPPSVAHQVRLFARRHRVLVGGAAVVLTTIIAATIAVGTFAVRAARESKQRALAEESAIAERDTARRQAYIASIAGAFSSVRTMEYAQARHRLSLAPEQLRNWEWSLATALIERGERTVNAHSDMIYAFAMSPDRVRFATGSRDGEIAVWNFESGDRVMRIASRAPGIAVHGLAYTDDGQRLVAGMADGTIDVWDAATSEHLGALGTHPDIVESVACGVGDAADVVVSASPGGRARIWSLKRQTLVREIDDQPGGIIGVHMAKGAMLTWGPGGVWVRKLDGTIVRPLEFEFLPQCAAASPDGAIFAAGGREGRVRMWKSDGELLYDLTTPQSLNTVKSMAFSADGTRLATGQLDRTVRVWDVKTGEPAEIHLGHDEAVSGVGFSVDGTRLASSSWDRTLRFWPINAAAANRPLQVLQGHEDHVISGDFSPNGSLLVSGGNEGVLRIWDPLLDEHVGLIPTGQRVIYDLVFSPDSTLVVTASDDGTAKVWSTLTGQLVQDVSPVNGAIRGCDISPDGRLLALAGVRGTSSQGVVRLWDLSAQKFVAESPLQPSRVNTVRFSPDGTRLAGGLREGPLLLMDVTPTSLTQRRVWQGHRLDVFDLAFSPDGQKLFSGSRDQTVGVWDGLTGVWKQTLQSQGQFITSLSMKPDGTRLAGGSWFSAVLLWDVASGDLVSSFRGHDSAIRTVGFSPDGWSLFCGGHDRTVMLYHALPRPDRVLDMKLARETRDRVLRRLDGVTITPETAPMLMAELEKEYVEDPPAAARARVEVLRKCVSNDAQP